MDLGCNSFSLVSAVFQFEGLAPYSVKNVRLEIRFILNFCNPLFSIDRSDGILVMELLSCGV